MSEADPAGAIDPWAVLGIAPTRDPIEVRRAYTRKLKTIDPEEDPDAFMLLRSARDWAMDVGIHGDPAEQQPTPELQHDEPVADEFASTPGIPPDKAAIGRLHAMVFDPAQPVTFEQVEAQARLVLADPAMVQIDHLASMENFFTRLIVEGTPRSDGAVALAIDRFGWRKDDGRIDRPPVIDWIVQRQDDIYFERALPDGNKVYADLLDRLRSPLPAKTPWWTAWYHAPRIEYFLAYLQHYHSTTIDGLHRQTLDWWSARITSFRQSGWPVGLIYRERYAELARRGFDQPYRAVSLQLIVVLAFAPWLFVWWLLLRGYSPRVRAVGFGWFGVTVVFSLIMSSVPTIDPNRVSSPGTQQSPASSSTTPYADFNQDLNNAIGGATSGTVDAVTLQEQNGALYKLLFEDWTGLKRDGKPIGIFNGRVADRLKAALKAGLASGDPKLVRDYALNLEAELRWAARESPQSCADLINGIPIGSISDDFSAYRSRLIGRAVLAGAVSTALPKADDGVLRATTIPSGIRTAAQMRSLLNGERFAQGLRGEGLPITQCNAYIGLLDAGIEGGDPGNAYLRSLLGGAS